MMVKAGSGRALNKDRKSLMIPGGGGRNTGHALPDDVDLVIFDCDGVLVDSEQICCSTLSANLRKIGLDVTTEAAIQKFLGRDFRAVEDFAFKTLGHPLPSDFRARLADDVKTAFAELLPIEGVSDAIRRLKVPSCVGSSSDRCRVVHALEQTGLMGLFADRIWTVGDVARGKPAPDIFLRIVQEMGIDSARTLVIEDSVNGVLAARAAGMRVWGFVGGTHYRAYKPPLQSAGAQIVFDDMAQLWSQEP